MHNSAIHHAKCIFRPYFRPPPSMPLSVSGIHMIKSTDPELSGSSQWAAIIKDIVKAIFKTIVESLSSSQS